jgi:hypothetical protein
MASVNEGNFFNLIISHLLCEKPYQWAVTTSSIDCRVLGCSAID